MICGHILKSIPTVPQIKDKKVKIWCWSTVASNMAELISLSEKLLFYLSIYFFYIISYEVFFRSGWTSSSYVRSFWWKFTCVCQRRRIQSTVQSTCISPGIVANSFATWWVIKRVTFFPKALRVQGFMKIKSWVKKKKPKAKKRTHFWICTLFLAQMGKNMSLYHNYHRIFGIYFTS